MAIEVYACEGVLEVADVAAETFDKNGGDIRLFRGRSTEMEVGKDLPSRVPRVISELLGTGQSVGPAIKCTFLKPPPVSKAGLFFGAVVPGCTEERFYEVLQHLRADTRRRSAKHTTPMRPLFRFMDNGRMDARVQSQSGVTFTEEPLRVRSYAVAPS